jgi:hypothetical protein
LALKHSELEAETKKTTQTETRKKDFSGIFLPRCFDSIQFRDAAPQKQLISFGWLKKQ